MFIFNKQIFPILCVCFLYDKYDSSTECMRYLHWLPIRQRVKYKALTLIYKRVVSKTSPVYLQEMFKIKASIQHLKSAASLYHLDVPKTHRKTFAARSSVLGAGKHKKQFLYMTGSRSN